MQGTMKKTADIHTYQGNYNVDNGAVMIPFTVIPEANHIFVSIEYAYSTYRFLNTTIAVSKNSTSWILYLRREGTVIYNEVVTLHIMTAD